MTYRKEGQVTRSHRNEDRGGERRWTFNGVEYPTRKLMCAARREEYVRLLDEEGMNFTQAAHAVGVSKRTGKVWRNGRTRATGRNERASMDWYRSTMDKPKRIHARYLNQEERIPIADRLRLGDSIRVFLVKSVFRVRGGDVFLDSLTGRRTPSWRSTAGSSATGPWTCTSNTNAAPPT